MKYKYGFIGIGNMGGIILDTVLKTADAKEICACDSNKEKIDRATSFGVTSVDAKTAAENSKYLFIGVKPQGLEGLFNGISDYINEDTVIVSMAAGKEIKTIVATGGLAKEIVNCCDKDIIYNKNLVLEGLLVIYKKNR